MEPEFFSVTYGAGGSTREKTIDIVSRINADFGLEAMAHLKCVNATVDVRGNMPEGTAYLIDGTEDEPAGLLLDGAPLAVEVSKH